MKHEELEKLKDFYKKVVYNRCVDSTLEKIFNNEANVLVKQCNYYFDKTAPQSNYINLEPQKLSVLLSVPYTNPQF